MTGAAPPSCPAPAKQTTATTQRQSSRRHGEFWTKPSHWHAPWTFLTPFPQLILGPPRRRSRHHHYRRPPPREPIATPSRTNFARIKHGVRLLVVPSPSPSFNQTAVAHSAVAPPSQTAATADHGAHCIRPSPAALLPLGGAQGPRIATLTFGLVIPAAARRQRGLPEPLCTLTSRLLFRGRRQGLIHK